MKMDDVIQKAKGQNGNATMPQKDMMWYIVGRVDAVHDKLDEKFTSINRDMHKTFLPKVTFWRMIAFVMLLLGALASYVVYG